MKLKHVKICPRCKSLDISIRWQSLWFMGLPPSYRCMKCGYVGRIFPEITTSKLKKWQKRKGKR